VGAFLRGSTEDVGDSDDDSEDDGPDVASEPSPAPGRRTLGRASSIRGSSSATIIESMADTQIRVTASLHLRGDGVAVAFEHAKTWCAEMPG
jgi:hypothetical protein